MWPHEGTTTCVIPCCPLWGLTFVFPVRPVFSFPVYQKCAVTTSHFLVHKPGHTGSYLCYGEAATCHVTVSTSHSHLPHVVV